MSKEHQRNKRALPGCSAKGSTTHSGTGNLEIRAHLLLKSAFSGDPPKRRFSFGLWSLWRGTCGDSLNFPPKIREGALISHAHRRKGGSLISVPQQADCSRSLACQIEFGRPYIETRSFRMYHSLTLLVIVFCLFGEDKGCCLGKQAILSVANMNA